MRQPLPWEKIDKNRWHRPSGYVTCSLVRVQLYNSPDPLTAEAPKFQALGWVRGSRDPEWGGLYDDPIEAQDAADPWLRSQRWAVKPDSDAVYEPPEAPFIGPLPAPIPGKIHVEELNRAMRYFSELSRF